MVIPGRPLEQLDRWRNLLELSLDHRVQKRNVFPVARDVGIVKQPIDSVEKMLGRARSASRLYRGFLILLPVETFIAELTARHRVIGALAALNDAVASIFLVDNRTLRAFAADGACSHDL